MEPVNGFPGRGRGSGSWTVVFEKTHTDSSLLSSCHFSLARVSFACPLFPLVFTDRALPRLKQCLEKKTRKLSSF